MPIAIRLRLGWGAIGWLLLGLAPAFAQGIAEDLDLDPAIVEESPVLQRWYRETPDVLAEIRTEPVVPTHIGGGIADFDDDIGLRLTAEEIYLGRTRLSLAGDYWQSLESDAVSWGAQLRGFLRPLGKRLNVSPVVGYRNIARSDFTRDGLLVGGRLRAALSPGGGADASVAQLFLQPGSDREVSLTVFTAGYALTDALRLSATLQRTRSNRGRETDASIGLAWMLP